MAELMMPPFESICRASTSGAQHKKFDNPDEQKQIDYHNEMMKAAQADDDEEDNDHVQHPQ